MKRNRGVLNYILGSITSPQALVNMYIYGGSLLTIFTFLWGLFSAGTVNGATQVLIDFYIMKLFPWPLDELLMAKTISELIFSHVLTTGTGLIVASSKWWKNV